MRALVLLSVCLFFWLLLPASGVTLTYAADVTVGIAPSLSLTEVDQNFTVDVTVAYVTDLYAWEVRLSWNAALLEVVGMVEGDFLKDGGRSTFFGYNISSVEGRLVADCSLLGIMPGVSGSGLLATVTFYAKAEGECPLDLFNVSLGNSFDQQILCQLVDGYWRAVLPHDVAITSVVVWPLTVISGEVANANVTVENVGTSPELFDVVLSVNSTIVATQPVALNFGQSATVSFAWNTSGFQKGEYIIEATAGPVEGETSVEDNTQAGSTFMTIVTDGHDVAVTGVKTSKSVIGQGFTLNVFITVKNYGTYEEILNVTAYFDAIVATQSNILGSGEDTVLVFGKDTSSMLKGNYSVSASVDVVPGETLIGDNNVTGSWVLVSFVGDVNGDASVDIYDAILLSSAFDSTPSSINWIPNVDINCNDIVDIYDAILLSNNFGKSVF